MRSWWRCGCWWTDERRQDRRDELSALRVQNVSRLHRLLAELIPGGAPRDLTAGKAKKLLTVVRPRTLLGRTTRRMSVEELTDLVAVDARRSWTLS